MAVTRTEVKTWDDWDEIEKLLRTGEYDVKVVLVRKPKEAVH